MPYLKPTIPMRNCAGNMPGPVYQVHNGLAFFIYVFTGFITGPLRLFSYTTQNTVQAVSGSWYKGGNRSMTQ